MVLVRGSRQRCALLVCNHAADQHARPLTHVDRVRAEDLSTWFKAAARYCRRGYVAIKAFVLGKT